MPGRAGCLPERPGWLSSQMRVYRGRERETPTGPRTPGTTGGSLIEDAALVTAWAPVAIAIVTGGGAAATCFLIWRGIMEMRRSSEERARDRREAREADLRRHEEAMTALRALIGRGSAAA